MVITAALRQPHPQVISVRRRELAIRAELDRIPAHCFPRILPVIGWDGRVIGHAGGDRSKKRGWILPACDDAQVFRDCSISTFDQLRTAERANKGWRMPWTKVATATHVAGAWYDLWPIAGSPAAGTFTGAANTAVQHTDNEIGACWHGGDQGGGVNKHVTQTAAVFGETNSALTVLYDRVLTYEACAINTVNQVMTNVLAAQRYISAGEPGLLIAVSCQTALGATASAWTTLHYTDDAGNNNISMPVTGPSNIAINALAPTASRGARIVSPVVAGTTATIAPWLALAAGDNGVRKIADYDMSAVNTGTICFTLYQPLAWLAIPVAKQPSMADYIMSGTQFPIVKDGACLAFLNLFNNGNGITLEGETMLAWG